MVEARDIRYSEDNCPTPEMWQELLDHMKGLREAYDRCEGIDEENKRLREELKKAQDREAWLRTVLIKANAEGMEPIEAALSIAKNWEVEVERLRGAIRRHRDFLNQDFDSDATVLIQHEDETLWATLDAGNVSVSE